MTRRHSPAAERNAAPIAAQLLRLLPPQGVMLEIASGTGQHAAAFAAALPGWQWQPTEASADTLGSIADWCSGLGNVRAPLLLDVCTEPWPADVPQRVDAMFCANMIHASPWATTPALMRGAARHLAPHGVLVTYGPYFEHGVPPGDGNLAFDADLRGRGGGWGIRHLDDVAAEAAAAGLGLRERVEMPANNRLLVWARVKP